MSDSKKKEKYILYDFNFNLEHFKKLLEVRQQLGIMFDMDAVKEHPLLGKK